jgi:RHH-type rel operon transcriptional repressor/antitoxin RelB
MTSLSPLKAPHRFSSQLRNSHTLFEPVLMRYNEYIYSNITERLMPTSIRLPKEIEKRLDTLARQTGRTKAFYLREIILEHIDDLEDYYLAARVAERVRQGKEPVVSDEQVRKELGLED